MGAPRVLHDGRHPVALRDGYKTGGLGWSSDVGNEIYGLYLAFVYFTPYVGGLLAEFLALGLLAGVLAASAAGLVGYALAVWIFDSGWPDILVAIALLAIFSRSAVRVLKRAWRELSSAAT